MQFAGKIKALFLHFFEWRYEMRIAYVRVSTEEQNEARQREALKQYRSDQQKIRIARSWRQCWSLPEAEIPFIFMIFHGWQGIRRICYGLYSECSRKKYS